MLGALRQIARTPAAAFLRDAYRRFTDANVPLLGAGLTFYAAFSLGPLLLLLGGWLSLALRGRPEMASPFRDALSDLVGQLLPLTDDADALVSTSVDLILTQLGEGALVRTIFSVVVLLWASTSFFTSLQLALEMIFDVQHGRGYVRKRLVALLLVVAVAVFLLVEMVGSVVGDAARRTYQEVQGWAESLDLALPELAEESGFSPLRMGATALVFALCFRLLPRRHSDWFAAVAGGGFAAVVLFAMRQGLMATFSIDRFNLVYGVITGAVVMLLWLYLAVLGFLMGAVLAAEAASWRRRGARPEAPIMPADPG